MKRLVILGGGESGVGTAVLAKAKGYEVFLSDRSELKDDYRKELNAHNIPYETGKHTEELILNADEVVKSPGIPDKAPIVVALREKGVSVISEIEFAGRFTDAKMICITGSNGKTTTTMLTYHILQKAGLKVGLAGNVGRSFARQVAECNFDYYVIELSSFQLDGMYEFKADIAILLNITPDHLDRYEYKFQNYINSKFRIVQNQTQADAFIYWAEDPVIAKELEHLNIKAKLCGFALEKGQNIKAYVEDENLVVNYENSPLMMPLSELALQGTHNVYNSMAASLAAQIIHIRKETIRDSLSGFEGVEHRLEYVASVRGVRYVNDSKATNVNSCWYALQSMRTPTVLILGGTDKGNDYAEIAELVRHKVHTLIFLGVDNKKLNDFFKQYPDIKRFDVNSMEEAVKKAYEVSDKGDTVLLSPCCASFDLFQNYEDRGSQFKMCVKSL